MIGPGQVIPASPEQIPYAFENFIYTDILGGLHQHMTPLTWAYKKNPHGLIIGGTGSGKTTALKQMVALFALHVKDSEIFLCTYKHKNDDFPFLTDGPHFASYARCDYLFEIFYERFTERLKGTDSSRNLLLLVFDEWAGFLLSLDKTNQEEKVKKLGQILMMGRSMNIQVIVAMQRPDAVFFKNGARDNFNLILALGNLSPDGLKMVFSSDYAAMIQPCMQIGDGYSLTGGILLQRIMIPFITKDVEINLIRKLQ